MEHGKPFSATDSPLVDFDAVCQKVRAAVEPARAHAVSLHDENGDVLWLSESSMGPDEHNAVREAVEAFADATRAPPSCCGRSTAGAPWSERSWWSWTLGSSNRTRAERSR